MLNLSLHGVALLPTAARLHDWRASLPKIGKLGWWAFLSGLLATGVAAAWIGGRILARDTAMDVASVKVEQQMFDEAVISWNEFEARTQAQAAAMEAKARSLDSALTAMKVAATAREAKMKKLSSEVRKLSSTLTAMKAAQARELKAKKLAQAKALKAKKQTSKVSRR